MTPKGPAKLLDEQRARENVASIADRRRAARAIQRERGAAKLPPRSLMRLWPATTKAGRRGRKARARVARITARMGI